MEQNKLKHELLQPQMPQLCSGIPQTYVALDLETTGLDPKIDKIIEIGAIRVENGVETGHFQTLVNPHRTLDERVVELTGIDDSMVEDGAELVDILPGFLEFCGELPLLGHRVIFDYSFVKRATVNQGLTFDRKGIDTLKICRGLMPEEEKKNLEAACSYYKVTREGAHRALGDARDAHGLYQKLILDGAGRRPDLFEPKPLIYKVKREQPASKKQKEDLQDLLKYHRIDVPVQIDFLSRNEASRMKDKIISQYGRIGSRKELDNQ